MTYSILGARDLDLELSIRDRPGLVGWLKDGFERSGSSDRGVVGSAFPPLRLNPDRDALTQVAVALREAEADGQGSALRVRRAIRRHLTQDGSIQRETLADLRSFWQLLGAIGCDPTVQADARTSLELLVEFYPPEANARGELDEVVGAVMTTVASAQPVTASQPSFFRHVRRDLRALWRPSYLDLLIDVEFALSAGRRQAGLAAPEPWELWRSLVDEFPEMAQQVHADSAPGRAMLRSLFRRLEGGVEPPSGDSGARQIERMLFPGATVVEFPLIRRIPAESSLPEAIRAILAEVANG